jgi:hypothetical protein
VRLADDYVRDATSAIAALKKRPRQSVLRRAVSTAYYALFLELVHDAGRNLAPASPAALAAIVSRQLQHKQMVDACKQWEKGAKSDSPWKAYLPAGTVPAALVDVAAAFVELQEARHEADYSLGARLSKAAANAAVQQARDAIRDWRALRVTDPVTANVFLASLLHKVRA